MPLIPGANKVAHVYIKELAQQRERPPNRVIDYDRYMNRRQRLIGTFLVGCFKEPGIVNSDGKRQKRQRRAT